MQRFSDINDPRVADLINHGAIGVIRTDTLYGLVAKASLADSVERVYRVKSRDSDKPSIILISDRQQIGQVPAEFKVFLDSVWPGKNSVALPAPSAPAWLLRSGRSLAYRLPADEGLRHLIDQTGPLVAPSANPQGQPPAATVEMAVDYFGELVDFYVDGGAVVDDTPSALYLLKPGEQPERLR